MESSDWKDMVSEVSIHNYKSVEGINLSLGQVTVLIGENGSGKSNILEAITFLGAAASEKLDNEFLVSRGIRLTPAQLMCTAFSDTPRSKSGLPKIRLSASGNKGSVEFVLRPLCSDPKSSLGKWTEIPQNSSIDFKVMVSKTDENSVPEVLPEHTPTVERTSDDKFQITIPIEAPDNATPEYLEKMRRALEKKVQSLLLSARRREAEKSLNLSSFLIYSPENSALRKFEEEGQIQPIGVRGEGLFKLLQTFTTKENSERLSELKKSLELTGWFLDFSVPTELPIGDNRLQIFDRYLGKEVILDQRSSNEGFLFLLFYFSVILSRSTPAFFAIDNIDASLNPKLCAELMKRICELAKRYNKQVILTTHNPAILDGLNLYSPDHRLYTIYRGENGRTRARRIKAPITKKGEVPMKLSQAFLRGLIGGLPKNF